MVQVTRLAHVGLQAQSLSTQAEFYNDRWGLERVDEFGGELYFRADGPDHHVLTLTEGDAAGLHHVALQVPNPDDIDLAGVERVGDPCKHQDVKPTGLNQVVLNVRDQAASENFYKDPEGTLWSTRRKWSRLPIQTDNHGSWNRIRTSGAPPGRTEGAS